jgi:hypothetical protein
MGGMSDGAPATIPVSVLETLASEWEEQAATMERAYDLDDPEIWIDHARQLREAMAGSGQE